MTDRGLSRIFWGILVGYAAFHVIYRGIVPVRQAVVPRNTPSPVFQPLSHLEPTEAPVEYTTTQESLELHRGLFDAIREVESGNDDRAIGDGGASLGPYQISLAYFTDSIAYGKVKWDYHSVVWSRPHCEQIMVWYWQRYDAQTDEQRARMHNGGPQGHRKAATLPYWNKVKALLERG